MVDLSSAKGPSPKVVDLQVRQEVLDTSRSFVLQAPAGSGKTELLTQRILALLAEVEQPEKILAITFTKKAAAEMKLRVVEALQQAALPMPESEPEKSRWQFATAALANDKKQNWQLLNYTSRLQITTIDSLCGQIIARQPLLSQVGTMPSIAENADEYYQMAVERLLSAIDEDSDLSEALQKLLWHRDLNLAELSDLLCGLLKKRLQWLMPSASREKVWQIEDLPTAVASLVRDKLIKVNELIPLDIRCELPAYLSFISQNLIEKFGDDFESKFPSLARLGCFEQWAENSEELYLQLRALCEICLTTKNTLRANLNVSIGFPAPTSTKDAALKTQLLNHKNGFLEILSVFKSIENLEQAFVDITRLPEPKQAFGDEVSLQALLYLLPHAVAELTIIFSDNNVIDYPALNWGALMALRDEGAPTELALMLDYKIDHILVDEFQDTSSPQIALINALTEGWDASQSRTLFLVGDPMQSIYRFRDANVSLFLSVIENGLAHIKPEFRQLQQNFRSSEKLVSWVNRVFNQLMPATPDISVAAVSYAKSEYFHPAEPEDKVICQLYIDDEFAEECMIDSIVNRIIFHVEENRTRTKKQTLAVLGRNKRHLAPIAAKLKDLKLSFQGVELEPLALESSVSDLMVLALALADDWDELHWAALLRSPAFGLSQDELAELFHDRNDNYSALNRIRGWVEHTTDKNRLWYKEQWQIIEQTIAQKALKPYAKWLLGCYRQLTAYPDYLTKSQQIDLALTADKLAEVSEFGQGLNYSAATSALSGLFAASEIDGSEEVQLMTIHKSKGLEFDEVILPYLDYNRAPSTKELLRWGELMDEKGSAHFVFSMCEESGADKEPVFDWLGYIEKRKLYFELQRLLYVAATRAKRRLMLFGRVKINEKSGEVVAPSATSPLGMLWPYLENERLIVESNTGGNFLDAKSNNSLVPKYSGVEQGVAETDHNLFENSGFWRLDSEFVGRFQKRSVRDIGLEPSNELKQQNNLIDESAQKDSIHEGENSLLASAKGTLLHRALEYISYHREQICLVEIGTVEDTMDEIFGAQWKNRFAQQIQQLAPFVSLSQQAETLEQIADAICRCLADDMGREILFSENSQSEYHLLKQVGQGVMSRFVDRTYIKDGVRIIVDYKSSIPSPAQSLEEFVAKQAEQYHPQLLDYTRLFLAMGERKIVTGLYFPMLAHWHPVIVKGS